MPVSVTRIVTIPLAPEPAEKTAATVTRPPSGVYLMPLSTRLISAWRMRLATTVTQASAGSSACSVIRFCSAVGVTIRSASPTSGMMSVASR